MLTDKDEIPVWMAETDHCMLDKAVNVLDAASKGGPLTTCRVRAILEDIFEEWPTCGDTTGHQLEMVPKNHVQLLWLLGACRDPTTGAPLVAPDGHLVCAFFDWGSNVDRAKARAAQTKAYLGALAGSRDEESKNLGWLRGLKQKERHAHTTAQERRHKAMEKHAETRNKRKEDYEKSLAKREELQEDFKRIADEARRVRAAHKESLTVGAPTLGYLVGADVRRAERKENLNQSVIDRTKAARQRQEEILRERLHDVAKSIGAHQLGVYYKQEQGKIRKQIKALEDELTSLPKKERESVRSLNSILQEQNWTSLEEAKKAGLDAAKALLENYYEDRGVMRETSPRFPTAIHIGTPVRSSPRSPLRHYGETEMTEMSERSPVRQKTSLTLPIGRRSSSSVPTHLSRD